MVTNWLSQTQVRTQTGFHLDTKVFYYKIISCMCCFILCVSILADIHPPIKCESSNKQCYSSH